MNQALPFLIDVRLSDSKLGVDIGGTLAKMVIAMSDDAIGEFAEPTSPSVAGIPADRLAAARAAAARLRQIPPIIGATGRCPPELAFTATIHQRRWKLQFISASTHFLAKVLKDSCHFLTVAGAAAPGATSAVASAVASASASSSLSSASAVDPAVVSPASFLGGPLRQVVAAGGGAFKFSKLFEDAMGIELVSPCSTQYRRTWRAQPPRDPVTARVPCAAAGRFYTWWRR